MSMSSFSTCAQAYRSRSEVLVEIFEVVLLHQKRSSMNPYFFASLHEPTRGMQRGFCFLFELDWSSVENAPLRVHSILAAWAGYC